MIRINIKPLSVNDAWQGRRFKTSEYNKYERDVLFLLPKIKMPKPPYKITMVYGFSSAASDIDNPTKLIWDLLQKKYKDQGFNDKQVHEVSITKQMVSKGQEYFEFEIETIK